MVKLVKWYVHLSSSISVFETDLTFNSKNLNLIPNSLCLKRLVQPAEEHHITDQAERRLLDARTKECRETLWRKDLDHFFLERQLKCCLPEVFPAIEEFAKSAAFSTTSRKETEHKKLVSLQGRSTLAQTSSKGFVENLSKVFSLAEILVLAKGRKFNLTCCASYPGNDCSFR